MSKIIADLKTEGWSISDEDLTFLSPYLTPNRLIDLVVSDNELPEVHSTRLVSERATLAA